MEPKTIRCKFRCDSVTSYAASEGRRYIAKFFAVHSGSPENEKFFAFTPSGSLELGTYKENHFEPGKEYYLDLTLAEPVPVAA